MNDFTPLVELLKKVTRNREPLMREIAGTMHTAVLKNFEKESGLTKWPALKKSTIKDRTRKGYWPGRMLQRTGALKKSIMAYSDSKNAVVATNLKYAAMMNFGGSINSYARSELFTRNRAKSGRFKKGTKTGKGFTFGSSTRKIEARPFMVLPPAAFNSVKQAIISYLRNV